jgi:hypothetical protein
LLNTVLSFFRKKKSPTGRSEPYMKRGAYDGNVRVLRQAQLDKRTHFRVGESYKVGEGIATLHACKEDMLMAIMRVEDKAFLKAEKMREKGIQIMLMSPEELEQFQLDEWLAKRGVKEAKVRTLFGRSWLTVRSYFKAHKEELAQQAVIPSDLAKQRRAEKAKALEDAIDKEKVH